MILAVDVGNTNIVLGCIENDKPLFVERIATSSEKTELEYAVLFKTLLELNHITGEDLEGGIISSVVPPLTRTLVKAVEKICGISMMVVGPELKTGLNICTDNPAQVGADLVVNAVAGLHVYGAPLVLIDMGTATTISFLDKEGRYIGNIILPGVNVSLESLVNRTAQLPKISLDAPKSVIGTNTIDCMKSGIVYGQASQMDGLLDRVFEELGYECTVVATGGLAPRIIPHCKHNIILDDDQTLMGLNIIYQKNQ